MTSIPELAEAPGRIGPPIEPKLPIWTCNGVSMTPERFTGVWVNTHEEARRVRGIRRNGNALIIYVRDRHFPEARHCYGSRSEWKEVYDPSEERWLTAKL